MSHNEVTQQKYDNAIESIIDTIVDISDDEYDATTTLVFLGIELIASEHGKKEALDYLQFIIDKELEDMPREETLN